MEVLGQDVLDRGRAMLRSSLVDGEIVVPPGNYFAMGDNRDNSLDSRFWGPVDMGLVQGHAMFIYFSTGGTQWWNGIFNIRFNRMLRPIH